MELETVAFPKSPKADSARLAPMTGWYSIDLINRWLISHGEW